MLEAMNVRLERRGLKITAGTIVDGTIVHAPSSTKNREQKRDSEMHQTEKGRQRHFGMKAHVGVDSKTKIIHSAVVTAANMADSAVLPDLLHGDKTGVWGEARRGQSEAIHEVAPQAQDLTDQRYVRKASRSPGCRRSWRNSFSTRSPSILIPGCQPSVNFSARRMPTTSWPISAEWPLIRDAINATPVPSCRQVPSRQKPKPASGSDVLARLPTKNPRECDSTQKRRRTGRSEGR